MGLQCKFNGLESQSTTLHSVQTKEMQSPSFRINKYLCHVHPTSLRICFPYLVFCNHNPAIRWYWTRSEKSMSHNPKRIRINHTMEPLKNLESHPLNHGGLICYLLSLADFLPLLDIAISFPHPVIKGLVATSEMQTPYISRCAGPQDINNQSFPPLFDN